MDRKIALKQLVELKKYSLNMRLAAEGWKSDYERLISIILSARTRDETTIKLSKELFKKYPNLKLLSTAKLIDVESIIRPVNFYKNKSKNIIACSKDILERYSGKVPHDFNKLITLHGVGRKTANVFLSEVGFSEIGVDTHVQYISQKLSWTKNQKPEKIEEDLKRLFPKKDWIKINPTLVKFGKTYISRRKKDEILQKIIGKTK